jgi:peptidoglycan/LPS O-acetylase OafA/YrhL
MAERVAASAALPFNRAGALRYQPSLDGLRAIAALAVVGFHAHIPGFSNGSIGVDIFFTLSGFLITSILLASMSDTGQLDYRAFYTRRALRLLPAYFAVVAVAVIGNFVIKTGGTLRGALVSFFYVGNWAVGIFHVGLGSLGHTWSLSIEEQFYLVWPVLLVGCVRLSRGNLHTLRVMVASLVALSIALTVGTLLLGVSAGLVYNATPTRAMQLLIGALLATWMTPRDNAEKPRRRFSVTSAIGLICLTLLLVDIAVGSVGLSTDILFMWPTIAILTAGVIFFVLTSHGILRRILGTRVLVSIGKRSYGLYLWHFVVLATIDARLGLTTWPPRILGIAITAILVPLSYRYIERPFLLRKAHYEPRQLPQGGSPPSQMNGAAQPSPYKGRHAKRHPVNPDISDGGLAKATVNGHDVSSPMDSTPRVADAAATGNRYNGSRTAGN